jgi:hypothetical protein
MLSFFIFNLRDLITNLIVDVARTKPTAEILIEVDMLKYVSNQEKLSNFVAFDI